MEYNREKTILIDGVPFVYKEKDMNYNNVSAITIDEASKLLSVVKQLFSNKGLEFYLAYGTLLGAIREKSLIPGDEDVDIFVTDEKRLFKMLPYLDKNGLHLIRLAKGNTYSFCLGDHGYIDVYILRPLKFSIWNHYCYSLSNMVTPKKFFESYDEIEFLGGCYKCPKNPEKLIEFWYGHDWKTPIRGHKFYYEVKSAFYWHSKVKPIFKSIVFYDKWAGRVKSLIKR